MQNKSTKGSQNEILFIIIYTNKSYIMTKELYNELVKKGLITDTKMTLEYINSHKLELKDIITVPAILATYLKKEVTNCEIVEDNVEETVVEETVETAVEETVVEETVVEETVETVVEETAVEEIVVDEPEVVNTPKSKGKNN